MICSITVTTLSKKWTKNTSENLSCFFMEVNIMLIRENTFRIDSLIITMSSLPMCKVKPLTRHRPEIVLHVLN